MIMFAPSTAELSAGSMVSGEGPTCTSMLVPPLVEPVSAGAALPVSAVLPASAALPPAAAPLFEPPQPDRTVEITSAVVSSNAILFFIFPP